jgi:hypothetical protein
MKKILKIGYFSVVHILAAVAVFLMFTALAVKFKWTNNSGSVDENNRYFSEIADKYDDELTKDTTNIAAKEFEFFQKLAVVAKYKPADAKKISEAYNIVKNPIVGLRMIDAFSIMMKKNKEFQEELSSVKKGEDPLSIYEWSNYQVWKDFCKVVRNDRFAIDSVSRLTGVESRLIVMCLVGEQVRMFNSGREKFKKYVLPFNRIMLPTNRGYGVTGILEHTAYRIENTIFNKKSEFYAGDYFQNCINVNDSFPELVNDTIKAHKQKTIQRLIQRGDHYYSYLYTAFLLRQYQAHWERNGYTLENRPEILGSLFNLGYQKSKPKKNPEAGGSTFNVGGKDYTFGGLCFEFYYSGQLQELFPITGRAFIPVKELERKNKEWIASIKKKVEEEAEKKEEEEKKKAKEKIEAEKEETL